MKKSFLATLSEAQMAELRNLAPKMLAMYRQRDEYAGGRLCFVATATDAFGIGIAEENRPGYLPVRMLPQITGPIPNWNEALELQWFLNSEAGILRVEALDITISSMRDIL